MADLSYVVGDTAPSIFGTLTDSDGQPFDLTDATVRFQAWLTMDRRYSIDSVAVIVGAATDGEVRYDLATGDLSEPGEFSSRWLITFTDSSLEHTIPANTFSVAPL